MDLKQLIGETTEYDKKQMVELRKPKSWCKSISAFANGKGGTLIFGISDDNKLMGLENAENDAEKISEIIKLRMNPIPEFNLKFYIESGKKLIVLYIYASNQTPCYYMDGGTMIAYLRIGNQSVQANAQQLNELILRGTNTSYDSQKSRFNFENMSFSKLKSVYYQQTGLSFEESDYESFGIVDEKGNLTNAGALLADESPIKHSRIFCTRWNGLNKAYGIVDAIDDIEISGSIIILLQDSMTFVRKHSKKMWQKNSMGRIEMPDYPERAVLEGIVNAIIHRSYLDIGSEIHIDMFDDRMEIYSPGGMPDGSIVQNRNLMNVPSRRNPVIADIFNRLKYMDRRGSGFKKIISTYKEQVNYNEEMNPVFYSEYDSFFLKLKNLNYKNKETTKETTKEKGRKIIEIMKKNPYLTAKEISYEIGDITENGVRYHIKKLKETGIIEHIGSTKKGYWKINK